MQKTDAEVGAHDAGVVVDEGLALVGVELVWQASAQHTLFEAVQEAGRIAARVIGGVRDEAAVIVDQDTELGRDHVAFVRAQRRAAGEVHHPKVVGRRRFKGLGRTVFQTPGFETAAVVAVDGKEAQHRAQRRQSAPVVLPVPVENRDRCVRALPHPLDDPQTGFIVDSAAFSSVGPAGFACQRKSIGT